MTAAWPKLTHPPVPLRCPYESICEHNVWPFLLRRSRGLAAIAQAFMPSVPLDFVAFNLGLDSGPKVRNATSSVHNCVFCWEHSAAALTKEYALTAAAFPPGCEAGKGEQPGGGSALADAAHQDSRFQETCHWPAKTRLTVI